MDDEERLEGEEEMELDEASEGEDDDEENSGIPISPANSDQLLGPTPTSGNSQWLNFDTERNPSHYLFFLRFHNDAFQVSLKCSIFRLVTPEEVFHDPLRYQKFSLPGGKPLNIRRGPGRPRKDRPLGLPRGGGIRRTFGRGSTRGKGYVLWEIVKHNHRKKISF